MRRLVLIALAAAASAVALAAPASASSCYTLGVPGQDHYEYCTTLPIDPNGILR